MNFMIRSMMGLFMLGISLVKATEGRHMHYDAVRYWECAQAIENGVSYQSSSFFGEPILWGSAPEGESTWKVLQIKNACALLEHKRLHEQLFEMLTKSSVGAGIEELELIVKFLRLGLGIHFQDGSLLTTHISLDSEDGVIMYRDGVKIYCDDD
ncbi:MAG: hypothetical protein Q8K36_01075 [Alphaproteobacteria bacterium]|nr:hypothetical protein [Alphaproteobacteria bacterium]